MVLQVFVAEAECHCPIETQLDHEAALAQHRIGRLVHLIDPVLEPHRVVVGHDALVLHAQDRRQIVPTPQRPVAVAGAGRRDRKAAVELRN